MDPKPHISCILSINVHEKKHFLLKQIENIHTYVQSDFLILLNCNDHMFHELKDHPLPPYVRIHPEFLNKRTFHGSIMRGIYTNMLYALEHFEFLYFIVLSSRNMFYNTLTVKDLMNRDSKSHSSSKNLSEWHWPSFTKTKLAKYYLEKSLGLYVSAHEGFVISMNVCKNIHNMLERNIDIRDELFHWNHVAEEFSLQTISMNERSEEHNEYGWINIGHGCYTQITVPTDPNLFVYKTIRN